MPATWNDRDAILDACHRVQTECPGWRVWWDVDDEHGAHFCARPDVGRDVGTLHADNIYVLCVLIKQVEGGPR